MNSPTHHNALPAGYQLHWYEIESVLGQGGFGITYLARDSNLGRAVAIKEFLPSELAMRTSDSAVHPIHDGHRDTYGWGLDRFLTEARTLAQFQHPNIVTVYSVFEANATAYMVMEYEQGLSLEQALRSRKLLGEAAILRVLHPLLSGLSKVHEAGFIHRDIKPDNIFLRHDGVPVLLDFGSARQAFGAETRTLTSLVTPGYAPFEQYNSTRENDRQGPWTDIYSLGAMLYRVMTGQGPIEALTRADHLLTGEPDPVQPLNPAHHPGWSTQICTAIDAALQFQSKDRPQSIAAWLEILPPLPSDPQDFDSATDTGLNLAAVSASGHETATHTDTSGATVLRPGRQDSETPPTKDSAGGRPAAISPAPEDGYGAVQARQNHPKSNGTWLSRSLIALGVVAIGLGAWVYLGESTQHLRSLWGNPSGVENPKDTELADASSPKNIASTPVADPAPKADVPLENQAANSTSSQPLPAPNTGHDTNVEPPANESVPSDSISATQTTAATVAAESATATGQPPVADGNSAAQITTTQDPTSEVLAAGTTQVQTAPEDADATAVQPGMPQADDITTSGADTANVPTDSASDEPAIASAKLAQDLKATRVAQAIQDSDRRQAEIEQLLQQARDHLAARRLTKPAGDNAHETLEQLLILDPSNAQASELLQAIVEDYLLLAERAASQGNFDSAERFLDRAATVLAGDPAIATARAKLDEQRAIAQAAAKIKAQAQAKTAQAAAEEAARVAAQQARDRDAAAAATAAKRRAEAQAAAAPPPKSPAANTAQSQTDSATSTGGISIGAIGGIFSDAVRGLSGTSTPSGSSTNESSSRKAINQSPTRFAVFPFQSIVRCFAEVEPEIVDQLYRSIKKAGGLVHYSYYRPRERRLPGSKADLWQSNQLDVAAVERAADALDVDVVLTAAISCSGNETVTVDAYEVRVYLLDRSTNQLRNHKRDLFYVENAADDLIGRL